MFVSLTALAARDFLDGHSAARPWTLPPALAAYALHAASAGNEHEARLVARTALLFMQLSRPSFCESYERRIFETTGSHQTPRFGSLAVVVIVQRT